MNKIENLTKNTLIELDPDKIPFKLEDITDVRMIIKVGEKHYAIGTKGELPKELGIIIRKNLLYIALEYHDIIIPDLESLKKDKPASSK